MKHFPIVVAVMTAALAPTPVSAQSINLTGIYKCVRMCQGNLPAYITQNGTELNLLTEAGQPSRAWPDWYWPATRIWIDAFSQSAVYSPDGMLIQFDNGTIWQRDLGPVPPPPRSRR
ncbi:hypothetical protein LUI11_34560 [Bradyrhizobium diazoefficiens]|jgi:hypothetical protein|uniref:Bulb-type lectin domain-containing protein n=1 Tax=Bradyrhizobium diazoefficiens SEMIA 5080 TaxID=754504 RepID=A0A837CGT3_9BRAD|nr:MULTISPECIES: hypothetical protein [Bradyrhizobium]KGJ68208.1 hypothetical protein BJA5080_00894 [Bradyrhizobium diazoefficiens SEMIA 5080]MCD9297604.1 hypothetical protein [Bradyrhizobium diazoefficiens]MCD9815061.1 hypothetical protein [Bradyrhizobium diazoefficiens]MCD9833092.1 hypothetical protein [Bradyrhizobium diazoefficiens]MCD9851773.1 hypothetical protein [Bradyrhizobium diazoefficiens]